MSRKTTGVEAVLFDLGGTLFDYNCLRPTMHDALIRLCDRAQLEASETSRTVAYVAALRKSFSKHVGTDFYLMRDIFREAAVDTLEWLTALGDITKAAADPLSGLDDRPQLIVHSADVEDCDPFLAARADEFQLRSGVIETLRTLRSQGLRVGIVTNMDVDQLRHLLEIAELRTEFDLTLCSEEVGSCKPDSRIFSEAVRRVGSTPSSIMFVGDSIYQDIEGARRAGLQPVHMSRRPDDHASQDQVQVPSVRTIPDLVDLVGGRIPATEGRT